MSLKLYEKAHLFFKTSIYVLQNKEIGEKIDDISKEEQETPRLIDSIGIDFYYFYPSLLGLSHSYELQEEREKRNKTIELLLKLGMELIPDDFYENLLRTMKN